MKTAQSKTNGESVHHSIVNHEKQAFFSDQTHSHESFFSPATIQPKLKIGAPDDQYERQANRVAEAVVSSPAPEIQQQKRGEEDELQMKSETGISAGKASPEISKKIQTSGGGTQLPDSVNNEMSQKIGADFSSVNIHKDHEASLLNQSMGARAFTHGNNIFFKSGEYNPGSREGKRLLAHELTHVVQQGERNKFIQRDGGPIMSGIRDPSDLVNQYPSEIEVTAIDTRVEGPWYFPPSYAGWLAAATRIGEVEMTSVITLVENVINSLRSGQKISRLNILDHGNENGVQIGDDWINSSNVSQYSGTLSRLTDHFTSNAFVHFQNCRAGQNTELMAQFASALNISVYAGTGLHNPIYRINLGEYVRVDPDGTVHPNVGRP